MAKQLLNNEHWKIYCQGASKNDCRIFYGDSTRRWAESKGLVIRWAKIHAAFHALLGSSFLWVMGVVLIAKFVQFWWNGIVGEEFSYWRDVGIWPILGFLALSALAGLIVGAFQGLTEAFKRSFSLWLASNEEIYIAALREGDISISYEPGRGAMLEAVNDL